jgi:methionine biosynthesis protein MetW
MKNRDGAADRTTGVESMKTHPEQGLRPDLAYIADWIPTGSRVLDLGCGDGSLLAWLSEYRGCQGYGAEIAHDNLLQCLAKKVNVVQANIDEGLEIFSGSRFDLVILSQALQATQRTEHILTEIAQLAREVIVSIPNFGHWSHLASLARGYMPVNQRIPFQWYDTPNLHFATTKDFEQLLSSLNMTVLQKAYLQESGTKTAPVRWWPTLRATLAIYRFQSRITPPPHR